MIALALLAGVPGARAQVLIPSNAPAGGQSILYWPVSTTNYLLQTTANPAAPNWMTASNAVPINAVAVTNALPAAFFRLKQTTIPPGMALIPAGWFRIGNYIVDNFYNTATNDPDITDALPTNVYVSAFYMDVNLVSYSK